MNEIEELRVLVEELNKQFDELLQKQEIKEEKLGGKIWKPNRNELFYYIDCNGEVINNNFSDCEFNRDMVNYGNYFDNREQAMKQAEFNRVYNRFRKYVEAYSEPLDWNDREQEKYYIYYSHNTNYLTYCELINCYAEIPFQIYASSEQVLRDAVIYSAGSEEEFARIVFGVE